MKSILAALATAVALLAPLHQAQATMVVPTVSFTESLVDSPYGQAVSYTVTNQGADEIIAFGISTGALYNPDTGGTVITDWQTGWMGSMYSKEFWPQLNAWGETPLAIVAGELSFEQAFNSTDSNVAIFWLFNRDGHHGILSGETLSGLYGLQYLPSSDMVALTASGQIIKGVNMTSSVPEPSAWALTLAGVAICGVLAQRRRRA